MKSLKIAAIAVFTMGAVAGIFSGSALAAAKPNLVYGTVATIAATSFDVTTLSGSTTVNYGKDTKFVAMSAAGFAAGDAVDVNLNIKHGADASRVRYGLSAFPIDGINHEFKGAYQSDTGTPGTVTIKTAKGKTLTFSTTAATRYRLNGKKDTSPSYMAKDRLDNFAVKLTDSTWRANRVWIHRKK
jgi:hypothetical protein